MSQFENPIIITSLNDTFLAIQVICTTPLNTRTSSEPLTSGHMLTTQMYPTTISTFSLLTSSITIKQEYISVVSLTSSALVKRNWPYSKSNIL